MSLERYRAQIVNERGVDLRKEGTVYITDAVSQSVFEFIKGEC
jgi:hypothetical protein